MLHTWCGGLPVYLRARPRRFRCGQCRKVFVERFAGIQPWGRCTEQAEQAFLRELAGRSFRSTAAHLQVGVGVLRRVVLRRVAPQIDLQAAAQDLPELSLSLDEHSFRHQHLAVTVTAVLPGRQVVALLADDRKRTVEAFFRQMPEEVRGRIRAVCVDLKDTWRKLLRNVLPQAQVVADPFHVIQDAHRGPLLLGQRTAASLLPCPQPRPRPSPPGAPPPLPPARGRCQAGPLGPYPPRLEGRAPRLPPPPRHQRLHRGHPHQDQAPQAPQLRVPQPGRVCAKDAPGSRSLGSPAPPPHLLT